MHYTTAEGSLYNTAPALINTEPVLNTINPSDPSTPIYQYNVNTTNTVPAGYFPPKVPNQPEFSPRVAHKRAERDEPLEEGLVMHIREAFLPFNDPSPTTRASKR
jgi:hypothetical protein